MPPRIVTISDHIDCPTGFGTQHRILAVGLGRAGFDVHSLGLWDGRPVAVTPEGVTRYPGGQGVEDHERAWAMYQALLRPDLVITLGDLEMFAHLAEAERDFAWCHWLPLDAEPYPRREHERMLRFDHLVLMSRFALGLVRPHLEGRVPLHVIPHGVDVRVFQPLDNPAALRRRWGRRLGVELRPTDFILISRDANQWRKQQPLLLDALARMPREVDGRRVRLLFHCHPVAHPRADGWDLEHLARDVYGVGGQVLFTGRGAERPELTPSELAELDNLADLRVSATQGEGFGILTIEAMACGTPTLITDYTTSQELVNGTFSLKLAGSRQALPGSTIENHKSQIGNPLDPFGPAGELIRVGAWTVEQARHLYRPIIDASDLAAKAVALARDPGRAARYAEAGLRRVLASYTAEGVMRAWVALARRVLGIRPQMPGVGGEEKARRSPSPGDRGNGGGGRRLRLRLLTPNT